MFCLRYNGPNLVLKYNHTQNRLINIAVDDRDSPYYALRDRAGNAIGVTACDVDGDGREEIYFLNTNDAYSGKKSISVLHLQNICPIFQVRETFFLNISNKRRKGNLYRQALQVS